MKKIYIQLKLCKLVLGAHRTATNHHGFPFVVKKLSVVGGRVTLHVIETAAAILHIIVII